MPTVNVASFDTAEMWADNAYEEEKAGALRTAHEDFFFFFFFRQHGIHMAAPEPACD